MVFPRLISEAGVLGNRLPQEHPRMDSLYSLRSRIVGVGSPYSVSSTAEMTRCQCYARVSQWAFTWVNAFFPEQYGYVNRYAGNNRESGIFFLAGFVKEPSPGVLMRAEASGQKRADLRPGDFGAALRCGKQPGDDVDKHTDGQHLCELLRRGIQ